jgi:hypothetical protein
MLYITKNSLRKDLNIAYIAYIAYFRDSNTGSLKGKGRTLPLDYSHYVKGTVARDF